MLITGSPVYLDGVQMQVKVLSRVISSEFNLEWSQRVYNLVIKLFNVFIIFEPSW